jgi:hypothetical protein
MCPEIHIVINLRTLQIRTLHTAWYSRNCRRVFTIQAQKIFPKVETIEKLVPPAEAIGRITLNLQSSGM